MKHGIWLTTCQKMTITQTEKKRLYISDALQIPDIERIFSFPFYHDIYKQHGIDQNIIYVCIAKRQTAEVNEAKEWTNANVLVCLCSVLFLLLKKTQIADSVTNVIEKYKRNICFLSSSIDLHETN